jgi:hypothetical protein
VEKIEIKIFVITFLKSGKSGKMETRFIDLCKKGDLIGLQQLLELHPDINISADNECAFRWTCAYGHLHVCQWLLQVKPDINISALYECAFRVACYYGHLDICQWLLQVSKEKGQDINISALDEWAFRHACLHWHLHVAQWLQSLKPYLYVINYDEDGKYKGYRVRSKEEANWHRRKYLLWLASNECPEQNKSNLLYKLPSDVSRMVIGFI